MHFTNAFIEESHRKSSLVHTGLPHFTKQDIQVDNYIIPANTSIFPNLYHVMHDASYWNEPELFNPYRFLDANGQFHHDERMIAFSVGKRFCLGQSLAEKQIFLFITGIVQNFQIILAPGQQLPGIGLSDTYPKGFGRKPPRFEVIFKPIK